MQSYFLFFLTSQETTLLQQPKLPSAFTLWATGFFFFFVSLKTSTTSSFISSSTTCDGKMLSAYSWIAFVSLCCPSRRIQDGYATHEDQSLWLWNIYVFLIRQPAADNCNITLPLLLCLPALTHKVSACSSSLCTQTSMHSCFSCT